MIEPVEISSLEGAKAEAAHAAGLSRRTLLGRAAAVAVGLFAIEATGSARASAHAWPGASAYDGEVPTAWFDLALGLVRTTQGFSPPVVSRAFGYAGVALYEAVAPGMTERGSFVGVLNGLPPAPGPADSAHHWPTVANSALAAILRLRPFVLGSGETCSPGPPPPFSESVNSAFSELLTPGEAHRARGRYRQAEGRGATWHRSVFWLLPEASTKG